MHITILTIGSRGDVQPYLALGYALHRAGHTVRMATHENFKTVITEHGLAFAPIHGNPKELIEGELGQQWLESGHNPIQFFRRMVKFGVPLFREMFDDAAQLGGDTDALIFSTLGFAGYHLAEKYQIPCLTARLQPLTRTRKFPTVLAPDPNWLNSGLYNRFSHFVNEALAWLPFRTMVNQWREERLGLAPFRMLSPEAAMLRQQIPVLYGYSPAVLPPPADWPEWVHVTGYWFLDPDPTWQPPADLVEFLAAGEPPVYVGFGSMVPREPRRLTEMVIEALQRVRARGVLLGGWSKLGEGVTLPDNIFVVESIPHAWLFPQMAAIVHHGGAGTTAASLRSGKPSILTPFFADQPFWAERVEALGVGPQAIPIQELTADNLASAIRAALTNLSMRGQAADLGHRIRREDGLGEAVRLVERYFTAQGAARPIPAVAR